MSMDNLVRARAVQWEKLFVSALSLGGSLCLAYYILQQVDPSKASRKQIAFAKKQLKKRLGRNVSLTNTETVIANDVVTPADVDVMLKDIGGLQDIIARLVSDVVRPLRQPELFSGSLLAPSRGILLYGRPGVGKTMLAKALAKESGASFINVRASSIQSKWFGESQKHVAALFSLAAKIQPVIIFIDEVDGLLGQRRGSDHEATTSIKTEFMQAWDGLLTNPSAGIMVLGATNRRDELDEAVLRRFALQLEVPMPDETQRRDILRVTLLKHRAESPQTPIDPGLLEKPSSGNMLSSDRQNGDGFKSGTDSLSLLAASTAGLSGSDLVQLCSEAARIPMEEYLAVLDQAASESQSDSDADDTTSGMAADGISSPAAITSQNPGIRQLVLGDFMTVLPLFKPSTAPSTSRPAMNSQAMERMINAFMAAATQGVDLNP